MRITGLILSIAAAGLSALGASRCTGQSHSVTGSVPAKVAAGAPKPRPAIVEPTVIGMNMGLTGYGSPVWAFADLVRDHANPGLVSPPAGVTLKMDEGGNPIDVPKGARIDFFLNGTERHIPATYRCTPPPPGWKMEVGMTGLLVRRGGDYLVVVPKIPSYGVSLTKLNYTAEKDGLKLDNVHCRRDGSPPGSFSPVFLNDVKAFRVIRFMNWMKTNNQPPQTWENRPKPTDFSIVPKGTSVEEMVELANTAHADPWFTLPFDADPAYYRNFAIYVRDHLAPDLKAYVELSNEVWNTSFTQGQTAVQRGKARYPRDNDVDAADFYYGDRVRDLMKVWSDVFAGQTGRIVRVVATQHVWTDRAAKILGHNDTWRSVDVLASAPYFGSTIQGLPGVGEQRIAGGLARIPAQITTTIDQAVALKAVANRFGLRYVAYEGGPDILGFTPDAAKDATALAHDPRFKELYTSYLEQWRRRVGGVLVLFDWGDGTPYQHIDYMGQPPSEAPKLAAVLDFIARKD